MSKTFSNAARSGGEFLKTTVVGGLVFLAPAVVLVVLFLKAMKLLKTAAQPITAFLPAHTALGVVAADVIVVALLLVTCFAGGLLARVSFANRVVKKAEAGLWQIPGYGLVRALTDSLDKRSEASSMRPVLVHLGDHAQLAFEVEELTDGRRVVFVPGSPNPRSGSVLVVNENSIEAVPATFASTITTLSAMGRGMGPTLNPPASSGSARERRAEH